MNEQTTTHVPNDVGNYRGKRAPGPRFNNGAPLTADEQRALLAEPAPARSPMGRKLGVILAGAVRSSWTRRPPPKFDGGLAKLQADLKRMNAEMKKLRAVLPATAMG